MIPKIIHQTWKGPPDTLPSTWTDSYTTWKSLSEEYGFTYMYWDDSGIDNFISRHFPWFLEKFRSYPYGIQRADTFRYFVLYHYGGIYSDFDNVPTREFFSQWFPKHQHHAVILPICRPGGAFANQNLTNYFLCSSPRHEYWVHVWDLLFDPTRLNKWKNLLLAVHYFYVIETTGPGIISDCYHALGRKTKRQVHLTKDLHHNQYMIEIRGSSWYDKDKASNLASRLAIINPTPSP
jgi:mannosyltransferase OCH1-like enzyme